MDSTRFDSLTRRLGDSSSRRQVCRVLAGGSLGVALTRVGLGRALAAKCRQVQQQCTDNGQCCGRLVCRKANSQHGCGGGKKCCVKLGGQCDSGCDCCGIDVICNGHVCEQA